jgi:hypothetical protein
MCPFLSLVSSSGFVDVSQKGFIVGGGLRLIELLLCEGC